MPHPHFNTGNQGPNERLVGPGENVRARLDRLRDNPGEQLVGMNELYRQWGLHVERGFQGLRGRHEAVQQQVTAAAQNPALEPATREITRLLEGIARVSDQSPLDPHRAMTVVGNLEAYLDRQERDAPNSPIGRDPAMRQLLGSVRQLHLAYKGLISHSAPGPLQAHPQGMEIARLNRQGKDPKLQQQISVLGRMVGGLATGTVAAICAYMYHLSPNEKTQNAMLLYGGLAATCLFGHKIFESPDQRLRNEVRFLDSPEFRRLAGQIDPRDMSTVMTNIQQDPTIRGQLRQFARAKTQVEKDQLGREIVELIGRGTAPATRQTLARMLATPSNFHPEIPNPIHAFEGPVQRTDLDTLVELCSRPRSETAQNFSRSFTNANLTRVGLPFVQRLLQNGGAPGATA